MEALLVKIFATALALSQVTTAPDGVKTQFDRARDQEQVVQLLHAGCTHMRKAFDIEDINLEDLIATALDDPQAVGENKAFRGINFADLQMAYREYCKNERVVVLTIDLGEVIDFYNKAAADLPDHTKLKDMKLPGASVVHDPSSTVTIKSVDRAAFYQLKTLLQGVLARGTARAIGGLSPYVAGKTGTSDEENDAWFVGFTNDVTVAVWIGYDNADGKRRTLGGGSTGGHVAVPIFEPVIQAVWAHAAPKAALAPPSPDAKSQLACKPGDLESGEVRSGRGKAFSECFRVNRKGKIIDTEHRLISHEASLTRRHREDAAAKASAPRNANTSSPSTDNAWSRQPWGAQQQWGGQAGFGQQWRDDRREWRSSW
jgi:Penicillin binding protein transpeptidase domain